MHPSLPVRTIPELIALAKKEPGKLTFASAGAGSGIHLAAEYFATLAGIKLIHVPYKGSGPALTDLIGGHVSMYFSSLPPAVGLMKEGKVRALAVTGAKRSPLFPDLPTVAETGLPGYEAVLHYGIVAPAGTPKPAIDKLSAALREAVMSEDLKEKLAARRRRAAAVDARGIRHRHRPRGDQVVGDRQEVRRQGEVSDIRRVICRCTGAHAVLTAPAAQRRVACRAKRRQAGWGLVTACRNDRKSSRPPARHGRGQPRAVDE